MEIWYDMYDWFCAVWLVSASERYIRGLRTGLP